MLPAPLAPGDLSSVKGMVGLKVLSVGDCKLVTGTVAGGPMGGWRVGLEVILRGGHSTHTCIPGPRLVLILKSDSFVSTQISPTEY